MEQFKQLVQEKYVEPKNEEILGSFLHIKAVKEVTVPVPKKKKKKAMTTQNIHKDIRNFFTAVPSTNANNKATKEKLKNVITID